MLALVVLTIIHVLCLFYGDLEADPPVYIQTLSQSYTALVATKHVAIVL